MTDYTRQAVKTGFAHRAALIKNRTEQKNKYAQALEKQRDYELRVKSHELADERFHYEKAKNMHLQISQKFPLGDEKADLAYANFRLQQPDQYKALVKELKDLPGAVDENGNIVRIPQYEAQKKKLDYDKSALEEKVTSGQATREEQVRYLQLKEGAKLFQEAESIAKTMETPDKKNLFDSLNPKQQSDLINQQFKVQLQSRIQSLQPAGQDALAPEAAQPEQAPTQPQGFFSGLGAKADSFFSGVGKGNQAIAAPVKQGTETNQATAVKAPPFRRTA